MPGPRSGSEGVIIATRSHKDIVGDMRDLVDHSFRVIGRVVLDWRAMLDLIHELDESLPKEYRDAQEILREAEHQALETRRKVQSEREQARSEAAQILEDAAQRARALASEHEIARLAEERAAELMRNAQDQSDHLREDAESYAAEVRRSADEYSDNIRRSTDDYALKLLSHLKSVVTRAQASVEDGLQQMKR